MPNENIIESIQTPLRQFGKREISLRTFADQFPGHASALEGLSYPQIKQAEMAGTRLRLLADRDPSGDAVLDQATAVVVELQYWLLGLPGHSTDAGE